MFLLLFLLCFLLIDSLGSSIRQSYHPKIEVVLFFSCLVNMLFNSFSFLSVMVRAFSTMLSEMIIIDVLLPTSGGVIQSFTIMHITHRFL